MQELISDGSRATLRRKGAFPDRTGFGPLNYRGLRNVPSPGWLNHSIVGDKLARIAAHELYRYERLHLPLELNKLAARLDQGSPVHHLFDLPPLGADEPYMATQRSGPLVPDYHGSGFDVSQCVTHLVLVYGKDSDTINSRITRDLLLKYPEQLKDLRTRFQDLLLSLDRLWKVEFRFLVYDDLEDEDFDFLIPLAYQLQKSGKKVSATQCPHKTLLEQGQGIWSFFDALYMVDKIPEKNLHDITHCFTFSSCAHYVKLANDQEEIVLVMEAASNMRICYRQTMALFQSPRDEEWKETAQGVWVKLTEASATAAMMGLTCSWLRLGWLHEAADLPDM